MLLLVDYREKKIIERLQETNTVENKSTAVINGVKVEYRIANLQVGDFIIEKDNNKVLLIERKSIKDLCASIIDGRFREQKERLYDSIGDNEKILYIIEGNKKAMVSGNLSNTIVESSIINLIFKHKYKCLTSLDENDTLDTIVLLYKKIVANEFGANEMAKTTPMKLVSKADKIKGNMMAIQLSVIPSVSYQTALKLSERYCNMKILIDAYNNCESEEARELLLSSIELNSKRKVGESMSKKIYTALMKI
jgi:crossover junction endonuclease MUS81